LVVALIIGAVAAGAAFVAFRPQPKGANVKKIPPALRPAEPDALLESERLNRVSAWGLVLTVFFAFFLPAYWLQEPQNRRNNEEKFEEESIERGEEYYAMAIDQQTGEPNRSGKECARCHGDGAQGGTNEFVNPDTGETSMVQVPDLVTVFARYEEPPPGYDDARTYIREVIERGRPGTDMPTWGVEYGGPLTEQEINDILNWLETIQQEADVSADASGEDIFNQMCASCHGAGGAGGSGPAMQGGSEVQMFPDVAEHEAFVKEGSTPGQPYGTSGMGTGAMPAWGGRLTDEQISAVVEYERSL
ncbi:MAG: c-type cytochrome, partial [Actinobacteria bacterium]|nr:c-type cytochrome [Actinomycetota bacterium]